jgi:hypothetical protein
MVERLLQDHPDCIIDFGACQSVQEDPAFAPIERALAPHPNVILLLPSPDLDESVRILRTRTFDGIMGGFDFHEHFVKHPSNHRLAKYTLYTAGMTPEETCDEIVRLVRAPITCLERVDRSRSSSQA